VGLILNLVVWNCYIELSRCTLMEEYSLSVVDVSQVSTVTQISFHPSDDSYALISDLETGFWLIKVENSGIVFKDSVMLAGSNYGVKFNPLVN
jgi:hypothetical protein